MGGAHRLHIDLETFSSVSIKDAGAWRYIDSPDFEILLLAFAVDDNPTQVIDLASGEVPPDWLIAALFDPLYTKHAHNAGFEFAALSKVYGQQDPAQWRCSMMHALYAGYPLSLEAAGAALGLPQEKQKLATGKALIRYFCCPVKPTKINGGRTRNLPHHDPEKWSLFKEYNARDVDAEREIERRLEATPVPASIQRQWETDLRINQRGVYADDALVQGALEIGAQSTAQLIGEARALTGLENPNSVVQMIGWLHSHDADLPDLQKETVADALAAGTGDEEARQALRIRQDLGKTSNKKYEAIETCVCGDGRIRGLLQFYGANRTGRWAGRLVQVQNLPRTYIHDAQLDLARKFVKAQNGDALGAFFGSVLDTLSQLIRTALIPAPGKVFIDADFSAIEARVISWLANEEWRLEVFRTHGKIYEASAAQMFGVPIERIKKGNPEYALRARGKVAELALGYQGGVGAMRRMDVGHNLDNLSDDEMQQIVDQWRATNPRIRQLWYDLQNAATDATQGNPRETHGLTFRREYNPATGQTALTVELPAGRKLYYIDPQIAENRWGGPSLSYLGIDQQAKKWAKKWARIETYGGKITENCLAWDTLVLTDHGAKPIASVTTDDKVWDGEEWVSHDGPINKGLQDTIDTGGIRLTPEHKVLTTEGWKRADEAGRFNWAPVQSPDGDRESGKRQERETPLDMSVRLWYGDDLRGAGLETRKPSFMRMHEGWAEPRVAGTSAHNKTRRTELVYDLRNCGPRHRFTVITPTGERRIVSNCVQAIARDCLAAVIERLENAGLRVVFHIHDEVVIEAERFGTDDEMLSRVTQIMAAPLAWAPGLPLNADGWVGEYFKKD